MRATNPATGEPLADHPDTSPEEVARRLAIAEQAFADWRREPLPARADRMRRVAALLRERRAACARLLTEEMGKPIAAAEAEIDKSALGCDFYADHAEAFLAPEEIATEASRSLVRCEPLGPVLAVMPWNFPFWQVLRFAAPALMAGNVALLKHAANVPGSALAIEALFRDAGFPEGVFTTLLIPSDRVAEVIRHPAVKAVTLTGSDRAGMSVAAEAGRALKKTVLELGGSDPFLVLADADLPTAAAEAAKARALNSGQSCICAKRFLVEEAVADAFEAALVARMEALVVGDPLDRATEVGPLAREDLLRDLHDQVQRSVAAGAVVRTGGRRLPGVGCYYAPTVLSGVQPGMAAFEEETFGPVAAVTRVRDADEAVELANRSRYGLGASVWTGDPSRGEELAARIEAGSVFVNGIVKSDPRLPFGGIKASGYGRELGREGIREFVNLKTVWVK
ncbi:MAG TPA: NAD-dependent succinate-semialdehyde dehydrogenase [Thermoanaerobaculia bacterium]|nr:NAD-dependent succinate-semialdehyde dehydrogenase [Thermoanaerobaculia bacterium]